MNNFLQTFKEIEDYCLSIFKEKKFFTIEKDLTVTLSVDSITLKEKQDSYPIFSDTFTVYVPKNSNNHFPLKLNHSNILNDFTLDDLNYTHLYGCPDIIKRMFCIDRCKSIQTLEGGPKSVPIYSVCYCPSLTSLKHLPSDTTDVYAYGSPNLIIEDLPETKNIIYLCIDDLKQCTPEFMSDFLNRGGHFGLSSNTVLPEIVNIIEYYNDGDILPLIAYLEAIPEFKNKLFINKVDIEDIFLEF